MADNTTKKVTLEFEVDGLDGSVKNIKQFSEAVEDAGKKTKKAGEEATIFGDLKSKFSGMLAPIKKVITSMKTLKGAIASTGIGLLVVAIGTLVSYFKNSEEGSKKLAIAMETISLLFGELTAFASDLGESLVNAFKNPKQALMDFGKLLVNQIVERVKSALEVVGFLGSALMKVFSGDFKGAMGDVKEAGKEMVDVLTGVDDSTEKIAETSVKVFKKVKKAVEEATVTATKLVDAQRGLRNLQQKLSLRMLN